MLRRVFLSLSILALTGCGQDDLTSNKYCNLRARFAYTPVTDVSQLYSSCQSMGQWCTIIATGNQFIFSNPQGSTSRNMTAADTYKGFYMGLSGFIVGLPSIPELGYDYSIVTCYDLACRNCYEEDCVTKRLTLNTDGTASCSKCNRIYNLNNQGIVAQGDAGKSLYRYRVTYSPSSNAISINN